jgi:hypothetical protein
MNATKTTHGTLRLALLSLGLWGGMTAVAAPLNINNTAPAAAPAPHPQTNDQEKGKIRIAGRVTDENGEGMDIVHVRLKSGTLGTLTNFKGEYELIVPAGDTMTVVFTSLGYKRLERPINTAGIKPDASGVRRMRLDVTLRTNTAVIGDVEVQATRQQQGTLERIEADNIHTMPSASGNAVEDMLGTMAGVTMNNERRRHGRESLLLSAALQLTGPRRVASGEHPVAARGAGVAAD